MPTPYAFKLARTAEQQYFDFRMYDENDPPLTAQIKKYWSGIDTFPGVGTPWSAVFVSWCVRTAGATKKEFTFAASHSMFVFDAIQNRFKDKGVFRAYDIDEVTPTVGDIIQNNRDGGKLTYKYASKHDSYASHSAIVIETGTDGQGLYVLTVGGNESDAIRRKLVRLDAAGQIVQRPRNPFMSIIKTLK
jgi:hypothetical protein